MQIYAESILFTCLTKLVQYTVFGWCSDILPKHLPTQCQKGIEKAIEVFISFYYTLPAFLFDSSDFYYNGHIKHLCTMKLAHSNKYDNGW